MSLLAVPLSAAATEEHGKVECELPISAVTDHIVRCVMCWTRVRWR